MNTYPTPATQPEQSTTRRANIVFPDWEQIPSEQQRKLAASLAAMVVKQLVMTQRPQEVSHD